MPDEPVLRQQLLALLQGGNAHQPFDEAVTDFPMDKINAHVSGLDYTPWRLLEHIRRAQYDILEFIRDPKYVSPEWPVGYWPPEGETATPEKWNQTIEGFHADHKALEDLVANPNTDLLGPLPHAPKYNILREILVVSDHNAYHIGEFGLLRSVLLGQPGA